MRPLLSALLILAALAIPPQQVVAQSSVNMRKTTTRVTIAGSHGLYDGSFNSAGTSSICGELPAEMNFAGVPSFIIEFPSDALPESAGVQSISFGSTQLVGKVVTASKFQLNIAVAGPKIGRPYAYVLITTQGKPKNTGVATLTKTKGGSVTLRVKGQNDRNETIDLTVTCT